MARRRTKKRTHVGASNGPTGKAVPTSKASNSPKSMVIRIGAGEVGPSVSQLVKDVRSMMEPDTASRLKERRANRLRDYVTMAGPLGVSHLMLFSRSDSGNTNMRLAITPRGPTLHFNVESYSLCKDIRKALKHPKGGGKEYLSPPLLVMNNFTSPASEAESNQNIPKHLESLVTTIFQSLFPPISPQTTPLSSIRRVMLLNREPTKENDGTYTLNLRHYAITTKATGLSKPLRRLNAAEKILNSQKSGKSRKGGVPNLGKMEDIADYMIGGDGEGYMTDATSGSEVDTDAEVEVVESRAKKILSKRQKDRTREAKSKSGRSGVEKRAVKLVELGPRMKLRMTKVEEGVCNGKIMWHEYIHKTKEEVKELDKKWEQRRQEKEARKKIQKENVEKKKKAKGVGAKADAEDEDDEMDVDEWDSEGLEGDGEMELNEEMEDRGEWEDEEEEIAAG
ncbi:Brix-domain-containing protein [Mollisia scopiformis]|uniref:Brix-domain-containing protein n=1 Tax=Mollisia scopiformis TaxID=149040 RepID=A0A132B701_MOLSC|nr:Brix-domain-containing protein [Mollisia scopiformis]KUJ08121.1 Brix-domain-containing protein [Mollisia scopiformis]